MRLNSELNLEKIDDEPSQNDGNIPSTHPNLDMIFLETVNTIDAL